MAQSQRRLLCGGTSRARPDRDPVAHPARVSARADRGRPSDQSDRVIALHLLDLLDEDGYLRAGLDEVTRLLGCGKGLEPATHSLGFESGVTADVSSTSCRQSPGFGHHRRQHGGQRDQMRQATTQKCILISRSGAINRGLRAPLAGAEHDLPFPSRSTERSWPQNRREAGECRIRPRAERKPL